MRASPGKAAPEGRPYRALAESSDSSHIEVKMLLFDWSRDPLFYGDEKALARIRKSQLEALHGLSKGLDLSRVMRKFVTDSGIAEAVEASLAY